MKKLIALNLILSTVAFTAGAPKYHLSQKGGALSSCNTKCSEKRAQHILDGKEDFAYIDSCFSQCTVGQTKGFVAKLLNDPNLSGDMEDRVLGYMKDNGRAQFIANSPELQALLRSHFTNPNAGMRLDYLINYKGNKKFSSYKDDLRAKQMGGFNAYK